jgi:hypothetical protein
MICHRYRCIFIHQRKCAGMSIMRAFGLDPGNPDWHFMNDGVLSREHAARPAGYFVFSVVRNPWDRFVSGWKYCESTRHRTLTDVLSALPDEGHDYRHLTRPQHAILLGSDDCLIADVVIRYESLQHDFDRVCEIIGKPKAELPRVNTGTRGPYQDYFDDESRRVFQSYFRRDIDLFGYSF